MGSWETTVSQLDTTGGRARDTPRPMQFITYEPQSVADILKVGMTRGGGGAGSSCPLGLIVCDISERRLGSQLTNHNTSMREGRVERQ